MAPTTKLLTALAGLGLLAAGVAAVWPRDRVVAVTLPAPVVIPFESLNGLIAIPVRINGSGPLTVLVDTGAKPSIIDIDRARALGIELGAPVKVAGSGSGGAQGAFIKNATLTLDVLPGYSQAVTLAIPLDTISRRIGRRIDGIVGTDFMRSFVMEVDYEQLRLTLHEVASFQYRGAGTTVPIRLDSQGHPTLAGIVTPIGFAPQDVTLTLDLGGSGGLSLHTPFVTAHDLPGPAVPVTRVIGTTGMGGRTVGVIGRLAALEIGGITLERPVAVFSHDSAGAYATASADAHVGARIASRFHLFLDLSKSELILEPHANTHASFDRPSAGLALRADGADLEIFRVIDVLEGGPGAEAGIQTGDVITAVDGQPTRGITLLQLLRRFEQSGPCAVLLMRDGMVVSVTLVPRVIT